MVLRDYSPEKVSEITGIQEETIVRLAREFAANRPALAVGERGSGAQSNGLYNRMAIHCLNALVGSLGVKGGAFVQKEPPFTPLPAVRLDSTAERGLANPRVDGAGSVRYPLAANVGQALAENIIEETPYRTNALLLYYSNPLFSAPKVDDFYRAFDKVPFIVSFSPFMDDSTSYADLVLPDSTFLERYQDDPVLPSVGFPAFGLRQPAIEPLHDTRNTGDVIVQLAKKMGGSVATAFPWADFEEALKERVRGVQQSRRGSIVSDNFDDFWTQLKEIGGWWDEKAAPRGMDFATPSGKFEFYSQRMKKELEAVATIEATNRNSDVVREMEVMLKAAQVDARGDELYLPHYEPPRRVGDKEEYPFYLNTYKAMARAGGSGANQPWLQEIFGLHVSEKWSDWLEINPEAAQHLGIADGAKVWVESPLGRIQVKARHYAGAMPDVISMPFAYGHRAFGRWAKGRGDNPNQILANESDRLIGQTALTATRVKVYPV
jgi:anaerobic selenocysteine-containing dehydrogenase